VLKFDISNIPVGQVVLSAPGLDPRQMLSLATDTIEPQLERIPGVSQAFVSGGLDRQLNVNVDPHRLAATGLTLQDVDAALRRYNALIPSGALRNNQIDFQLKVSTLLQNVNSIRQVVVTSRNGVPVHIGDIAEVQDASADQTQIVKVDGQPGITLSVAREPGANIVQVVDGLRRALPRLVGIPSGANLRISFDQSRYVRAAIQSLTHEALTGAVLTFLVILVFLPNLWNLFIIGIGLPLSVSTALILLYFTGQTINVFTLGGLTLALGRLVDDAIVVRENISRHLARPGTTVRQAVVKATEEVGGAVFVSTATTVAVFFPVVFLTGIARRLFVPMALTIVFAMSASYVVSMTIDPVLSMKVLRARRPEDEAADRSGAAPLMHRLVLFSERLLERLDAAYQHVLGWALRFSAPVIAGIAVVFALSVMAAHAIGTEFFPTTDESQFSVNIQAPQGTAVQVTTALADRVADIIKQVVSPRNIATITTNAGVRAGSAFGSNQGPNYANVSVRLTPATQRIVSSDEYANRVRRALDGKFPGVQVFISVGGLQRSVVNFGSAAPVDVQVLGYDQGLAAQVAQQVAAIVAQTPGTADVRINPRGQSPAFTVDVDNEKAAQVGLSPTSVANAITMAMSGNAGTATHFIDPVSGEQYGIVVQLMRNYRTHPEDLGNVPLAALSDPPSNGGSAMGKTPILLGDIARVRVDSEPLQISRKNQQRVVDVTANVVNRPLGAVSQDIVARLDRLQFPPGFIYHMAGQTEQQAGAFGSLGTATWLALMIVYMIMASQFKSLVDPFIIMFTVPLGLIGVIWMLLLTHTTLSIMSFMGVITMVGIVVSNGILLVDFANRLQLRGMSALHAVLRAGRTRLRPILMTALATVLGMIPMAIGLGEGSETNMPLARAVIGGLLVSTFLTLFLIPTLYIIFERRFPHRGSADA
jgi:multidrug efflux pump subunit AcrB